MTPAHRRNHRRPGQSDHRPDCRRASRERKRDERNRNQDCQSPTERRAGTYRGPTRPVVPGSALRAKKGARRKNFGPDRAQLLDDVGFGEGKGRKRKLLESVLRRSCSLRKRYARSPAGTLKAPRPELQLAASFVPAASLRDAASARLLRTGVRRKPANGAAKP